MDKQKQADSIIVLDYGSQYNQLITRRIRDFGIYSELLPHTMTAQEIKALAPKGIILSGGPNSVYDADALKIDPEIWQLGIPILGICYGMQLMMDNLGGAVQAAGAPEYGHADISIKKTDSLLFAGLPDQQFVWMSHGDRVTKIQQGFETVAVSDNTTYAVVENATQKLYGIQFHAEVRNTQYGLDILKNFAFKICGAQANWSMSDFIEQQIAKIRETVGSRKVLLGLSGGVDSSVVGVLLHKAIGNQLTSIFVDHGLLRKGEAQQVMDSLEGKFGLNIIKVNAQ
ncbi:glutamine-hydrolyzing GMP synthase, partial [Lactobacillus sp. XV13L]|nr:glutamine-hydrolyzing GMP synthase [Lactobacillus sp. XV13L]